MSQKAFYNEYWEKLQEGGGWKLDSRLKVLLDELLSKEKSVLDAGCGDGRHYGVYVADNSSHYLGLDISQAAVGAALQFGLNAKVVSFEDFFCEESKFDVALALEVIEHLFNPEILLTSLRESLKPDGKVLVSVPNLAYWRWRVRLLLGRFSPLGSPETAFSAPWRDPHIRFFTPEILHQLLLACGFSKVRIYGLGPSRFAGMHPGLFGKHIAAIADK